MDPDWFRDPPTLYYHPEHLGSTSFASNNEQDADVAGRVLPERELWIARVGLAVRAQASVRVHGEGALLRTGLYYFGARYYDPGGSVLLSPDPILDERHAGSAGAKGRSTREPGLYSYTLNNPVNLVDPDGGARRGRTGTSRLGPMA